MTDAHLKSILASYASGMPIPGAGTFFFDADTESHNPNPNLKANANFFVNNIQKVFRDMRVDTDFGFGSGGALYCRVPEIMMDGMAVILPVYTDAAYAEVEMSLLDKVWLALDEDPVWRGLTEGPGENEIRGLVI
jgi:hypothetical protein